MFSKVSLSEYSPEMTDAESDVILSIRFRRMGDEGAAIDFGAIGETIVFLLDCFKNLPDPHQPTRPPRRYGDIENPDKASRDLEPGFFECILRGSKQHAYREAGAELPRRTRSFAYWRNLDGVSAF
jgi:hypothetical protein